MVKRKIFNPIISKGQSCSKYNAPAKKDLLPTRFINIKTFEIIQRYLFMRRQDSLYVDINQSRLDHQGWESVKYTFISIFWAILYLVSCILNLVSIKKINKGSPYISCSWYCLSKNQPIRFAFKPQYMHCILHNAYAKLSYFILVLIFNNKQEKGNINQ